MTSYIPAELRRLVVDRSKSRCEYCLILETDTFCGCQIDHVIAEKHGERLLSQTWLIPAHFAIAIKDQTSVQLLIHPVSSRDSTTLGPMIGTNTSSSKITKLCL